MSEVINNEFGVEEIAVNPMELDRALKRFNWGVFGFVWLWGLGNGSFNKTWISIVVDIAAGFLNIIPLIGPILVFAAMIGIRIYLGINGNKWAFENRAWWSLTDFTETQKRWATATAIIVGFYVFIMILTIIGITALGALGGRHY